MKGKSKRCSKPNKREQNQRIPVAKTKANKCKGEGGNSSKTADAGQHYNKGHSQNWFNTETVQYDKGQPRCHHREVDCEGVGGGIRLPPRRVRIAVTERREQNKGNESKTTLEVRGREDCNRITTFQKADSTDRWCQEGVRYQAAGPPGFNNPTLVEFSCATGNKLLMYLS